MNEKETVDGKNRFEMEMQLRPTELSAILDYFVQSFEKPVEHWDYLLDPVKKIVVFKLWVRK